MRKRSSISLRERAAVGSSMMTMRASIDSARAIATRWRWAIDRSFRRIVGSMVLSSDTSSVLGAAVHRLPVDRAPGCARRMAEEDVFGNRQLVEEHGFLVDGGDAGVDGGLRAGKGDRLAVDQDLAFVRAIDAGQDLDERRFAGTVFADQRGDLARIERRC